MDRCRCPEYAEAVKKLKVYTVGTHMPQKIDKYDKTGFAVSWIKHGVDYEDMKFSKPKAYVINPDHLPDNILPEECRKIQQMWCPFMTPFKLTVEQNHVTGNNKSASGPT